MILRVFILKLDCNTSTNVTFMKASESYLWKHHYDWHCWSALQTTAPKSRIRLTWSQHLWEMVERSQCSRDSCVHNTGRAQGQAGWGLEHPGLVKGPCSWQGGWNKRILEILANPNNPTILWQHCCEVPFSNETISYFVAVLWFVNNFCVKQWWEHWASMCER